MDFSPLLILLFGGLIGWLFRHWRSADEVAARRKDDQKNHQNDQSSSLPHSANGDYVTTQSAHNDSRITTTANGVINGVAFTVIEQELDELYQLSARVKPLEFELRKAHEKLDQFKSIQEATSNDLDDTWVTLQDELDSEDEFVGFSSDGNYAVHVTSNEPVPDEVGELYQLVAQVKPLQYELTRSRKANNALAADKERVERRLRSQLEQNNLQQENHKLEMAKGLATQLTLKDSRIAELQARVEKSDRKHAELVTTLAESSAAQADQEADQRALEKEKQQLEEANSALQSELKLSRDQADKTQAESSAKAQQLKNELHGLKLKTDDQKIQLDNANKRLEEINQQLSGNVALQSELQKTIASKDEEIGRLSTQLDELSQTISAAHEGKNAAVAQADKLKTLLSKAETRAAELQVQQTQAEQQWRYEMSSLQALNTGFEEAKAQACEREATLEKKISQANSQRQALESRLKVATDELSELEQALESSQSSSQSYSEYSKIAEAKVIQLSNTVAEQESELEKVKAQAKTVETLLQQQKQASQKQVKDEQAYAEKYNAAELKIEQLCQQVEHYKVDKQQLLSDVTQAKQQVTELNAELKRSETMMVSQKATIEKQASRLEAFDTEKAGLITKLTAAETKVVDLNAALDLQKNNATVLERQTKELDAKLHEVSSGSKNTARELAELEQKRLSDAHKINELQALLKQAEARALQTQKSGSELKQLEAQVAMLKNETRKYAAFQKDAQATARELLEAKERLKELDAQTVAATNAADRLMSSNIENDRLQRELEKAKRNSKRVDMAADALAESKKRINELSKALSKAETVSKKAEQNDIELRRLRSELQALQAQRDNSVESLSTTASNYSTTDAKALEKLENDIIRRDQQIEQLKGRLADAQQISSAETAKPNRKTPKNRSSQAPNKPGASHASPVLFAVPKEKDDLKRVKGIGPVMEKTLNSLGITSFKQIAEFTKADIERVSDALETFPGRIERDDWVGGAHKQYKLKYQDKAEA